MKLHYFLAAAAIAASAALPANAAEETWVDLGNGLLRDDLLTAYWMLSSNYEFPVKIQESEQTPGRYRLVDAYRNCPSIGGGAFPEDVTNYVVVDASDPDIVWIEKGLGCYWMGQDQQIAIWSIADDMINNRGQLQQALAERRVGHMVDGNIFFPKKSLLISPYEGLEYDEELLENMIWKQANDGRFLIRIPGAPDYEVKSVGFNHELNPDGTAMYYDVVLGPDAEYARCAVFETDNYTEDLAQQIIDGTVSSVTVNKSGRVEIPYDHDGMFTMVVLPYYKDTAKSWAAMATVKQWKAQPSGWKSIGKGKYTEAILSSNELNAYGFDYNECTYDVEIEQKEDDPAYIRMVNPYGESYPYYSTLNYDSSRDWYLTFNIGYHNCVILEKAPDGIGFDSGFGKTPVWSRAHRAITENTFGNPNLTMWELINSELPRGKFNPSTRELTFDRGAILIMFPTARPDTWYECNRNGHFRLVLPEAMTIPADQSAGITSVEADAVGEAEYYRLDGTRADSSQLLPGIYIRRQGNTSEKVVIR